MQMNEVNRTRDAVERIKESQKRRKKLYILNCILLVNTPIVKDGATLVQSKLNKKPTTV